MFDSKKNEYVKFQKEWHDWIIYENVGGLATALDEGQEIDEILSDAFPEEKWTGFSVAAANGALVSMGFLRSKGAMRDLPDGSGRTPMARAAERGQVAALRQLASWRADANVKDVKGLTALHLAAASGSAESVRIVLEAGGEPNAKDEKGDTPLHFAARGASAKMVEYLMQGGASGTAENDAKKTPEEVCRDADLKALIKNGRKSSSNSFMGMSIPTGASSISVPGSGGNVAHQSHSSSSQPPSNSARPVAPVSWPSYEETLAEAKDEGMLLAEGRVLAETNEGPVSSKAFATSDGLLIIQNEENFLETIALESDSLERLSDDDKLFFETNEGMRIQARASEDGEFSVSPARLVPPSKRRLGRV